MGPDSPTSASAAGPLLPEAVRLLAAGSTPEAEALLLEAARSPDERTRLHAYFLLLPLWQHLCRYDRIDQVLAVLPELAVRSGDAQDRIQGRLLQAAMSAWQGRFGATAAAVADLAGPGDDRPVRMEAFAPGIPPEWRRDELLMAAALGLWAAGQADAAWRLADDTVTAWAGDAGRPGEGEALAVAAVMAQLDGDRARVARLADAVLERPASAPQPALGPGPVWAGALRAWATAESPPPPPGDAGPAALGSYLLNLRADREDTEPETALQLLDGALTEARRTGERFAEPETLRIRARVWHRSGRYDRAGADLDVAAAVAREQEAGSLELKALNDRLFLTGDHGRLGRLAALLEELGPEGPRRHTEAARRILERG